MLAKSAKDKSGKPARKIKDKGHNQGNLSILISLGKLIKDMAGKSSYITFVLNMNSGFEMGYVSFFHKL